MEMTSSNSTQQQQHSIGEIKGTRCSMCTNTNTTNGPCPICRRRKDPFSAESQEGDLHTIKIESSSAALYNNGTSEFDKDGEISCIKDNKNKKFPVPPRKWKYFPGKNRFYCDGRVMTAPSIRFCILCFGLIIVTFSLFIIFDGPFLAERLTIAIPIIGVFLFLSVMVNMFRTSFSDPGILPRASQQESEYMDKLYATNNQSRPPPRTKDIVVNGQTMKSKYCFTCKMFRPPRASHCGVCDNCVDRFDHHCPFLGNCIGRRNYRSFYAFILSLSFLSVFVLSCSIAHLALISKEKGNFLEALKMSPTSAVVVVISFFGMWTVLGLAGFHTYLIAVEQTTNEDIKGLFGRAAVKNPFSRGNVCQNCCFVLCGPMHPSLVDARGYATVDFLNSLPKSNEVTTTAPTSVCNPNIQSIKASPHCVDGAGSQGGPNSKVHNQQPLMQQPQLQQHPNQQQPVQLTWTNPASHYAPSNSTTNNMHPQEIQQQQIQQEVITPPPSENGSGIMYNSNSTVGINRSLGEIPSESLRNLYSSIEEDPTISADPHPNPNGDSQQMSSKKGHQRKSYLGAIANGSLNDDFDDPIGFHSPVSASMDHFLYDDIDDPLAAESNGGNGVLMSSRRSRKSNSNNKLTHSAISLPSGDEKSSHSRNNNKKKSLPSSISSAEVRERDANKGSTRQKNLNGSSRGKKHLNSTMINSPLHLDTIT